MKKNQEQKIPPHIDMVEQMVQSSPKLKREKQRKGRNNVSSNS
ncbi:hypothetical protein [Tepidibacillus sp. LV47]